MSTTKENIKSALKSKVIQMIFFYLLGASTVFVWQSDRHSKILLSYKDQLLERELALQRLETEKENAEEIFNSKLAQKDTLIKSYEFKLDTLKIKLKKDEKAIINYSGDFNNRFSIFSDIITSKD